MMMPYITSIRFELINQSTCQSINEAFYPSINESINQLISKSIYQSINLLNQSIYQSINQISNCTLPKLENSAERLCSAVGNFYILSFKF